MLCGDYFTYSKKSSQSGGSGHCRACGNENTEEDILHILTQCIQYTDLRETKIKEMSKLCETDGNLNFNLLSENAADLCQFLLDPTSLNLKNRINPVDPNLNKYFDISRSLCNSINLRRIHILKSKQKSTVLKHWYPCLLMIVIIRHCNAFYARWYLDLNKWVNEMRPVPSIVVDIEVFIKTLEKKILT